MQAGGGPRIRAGGGQGAAAAAAAPPPPTWPPDARSPRTGQLSETPTEDPIDAAPQRSRTQRVMRRLAPLLERHLRQLRRGIGDICVVCGTAAPVDSLNGERRKSGYKCAECVGHRSRGSLRKAAQGVYELAAVVAAGCGALNDAAEQDAAELHSAAASRHAAHCSMALEMSARLEACERRLLQRTEELARSEAVKSAFTDAAIVEAEAAATARVAALSATPLTAPAAPPSVPSRQEDSRGRPTADDSFTALSDSVFGDPTPQGPPPDPHWLCLLRRASMQRPARAAAPAAAAAAESVRSAGPHPSAPPAPGPPPWCVQPAETEEQAGRGAVAAAERLGRAELAHARQCTEVQQQLDGMRRLVAEVRAERAAEAERAQAERAQLLQRLRAAEDRVLAAEGAAEISPPGRSPPGRSPTPDVGELFAAGARRAERGEALRLDLWRAEGDPLPTSDFGSPGAPYSACSATEVCGWRGKAAVLPLAGLSAEVHLWQLRHCRVAVPGPAAAVLLEDCADCEIVCGAVAGSVQLLRCSGVCLTVRCRRLRLREGCSDCVLFCGAEDGVLAAPGSAAELRPYNAVWAGLGSELALAALPAAAPSPPPPPSGRAPPPAPKVRIVVWPPGCGSGPAHPDTDELAEAVLRSGGPAGAAAGRGSPSARASGCGLAAALDDAEGLEASRAAVRARRALASRFGGWFAATGDEGLALRRGTGTGSCTPPAAWPPSAGASWPRSAARPSPDWPRSGAPTAALRPSTRRRCTWSSPRRCTVRR
eukprot:TRINITY_DN21152_c0_g2_i1.p1 TRINITY_DN21152_c0_g2~~TRINITY_DN21152_c0_g2_i1.p1  ORF type:complete len:768 (+),score=181.24 TRINITY_DN21152_c0_g2_i1:70-2373(+)